MFNSSPFIYHATSTRYIMWQVIIALIPGALFLMLWQGWRWLAQLAIAFIAALLIELIAHYLRKRDQLFYRTTDGSGILTGLLIALSSPQQLSFTILIIGIIYGLVFGKYVFGGLGMNIFNPAMLGFAFLLISFPVAMNQQSGFEEQVATWWQDIDTLSAATILDNSRNLRIDEINVDCSVGIPFQKIILNILWICGGIHLIRKRCLDWRLTVATLLGITICAFIFYAIDSDKYLNPYYHLMAGSSIFGAVFIVSDPVTAATTSKGRWIYGMIVGFLTVFIRNFGNFPDSFAFSILLSNSIVVLIDPITQTKYK